MSGFFSYEKEKRNGMLISFIFILIIFLSPKYFDILFSKGQQFNIPNFSELLCINKFKNRNGPIPLTISLNAEQFMKNPCFLIPSVIFLSLSVFMTIQYVIQYFELRNVCSDEMNKTSVVPIFIPLISLFLILIFGFTSSEHFRYTTTMTILSCIVSIIYFIIMTHIYYKWDTSSWLAPIISFSIGYIIKTIFDYGIKTDNKYINWILLFFVFVMTIGLYSSYYSYSLAMNQHKICKTI